MRTALLALLTLSCAASAPPTPPDGDGRSDGGDACGDTADESAEICRMGEVSGLHYRAAVERCAGLQSARIEGACRVALAQAQAASPRRQPAWALLGAELCAPIEGARWRSDCWFILLDDSTLDVDPARWVEACLEHTGSYAGDCVMHGVDRWLIALDGDRPPRRARASLVRRARPRRAARSDRQHLALRRPSGQRPHRSPELAPRTGRPDRLPRGPLPSRRAGL